MHWPPKRSIMIKIISSIKTDVEARNTNALVSEDGNLRILFIDSIQRDCASFSIFINHWELLSAIIIIIIVDASSPIKKYHIIINIGWLSNIFGLCMNS